MNPMPLQEMLTALESWGGKTMANLRADAERELNGTAFTSLRFGNRRALLAYCATGQQECADWLRVFAQKVQFEELTQEEALNSLEKARSAGVQGARIYDYWHALIAEKAKADELITRNTRDFQDLANNVAWP